MMVVTPCVLSLAPNRVGSLRTTGKAARDIFFIKNSLL